MVEVGGGETENVLVGAAEPDLLVDDPPKSACPCPPEAGVTNVVGGDWVGAWEGEVIGFSRVGNKPPNSAGNPRGSEGEVEVLYEGGDCWASGRGGSATGCDEKKLPEDGSLPPIADRSRSSKSF